eukprot:9354958-Alexandrium_andersonii.AAC.1
MQRSLHAHRAKRARSGLGICGSRGLLQLQIWAPTAPHEVRHLHCPAPKPHSPWLPLIPSPGR